MTKIVESTDKFTLVILFKTVPEHQQKLIDTIAAETREWIRELPGFVSANLHKSADGTRVVNYGQWESADAWEEFTNDPRYDRLRERIDDVEGVELIEADDYIVDGVFQ
jgi:heme-degrading monooxygenase HmoA